MRRIWRICRDSILVIRLKLALKKNSLNGVDADWAGASATGNPNRVREELGGRLWRASNITQSGEILK